MGACVRGMCEGRGEGCVGVGWMGRWGLEQGRSRRETTQAYARAMAQTFPDITPHAQRAT